MTHLLKVLGVLVFFILTLIGLRPVVETGRLFPGGFWILTGILLLCNSWFLLLKEEGKLQTRRQRLSFVFQLTGFVLLMGGLLGISQIGFDSFGLGGVFLKSSGLGCLLFVLAIVFSRAV